MHRRVINAWLGVFYVEVLIIQVGTNNACTAVQGGHKFILFHASGIVGRFVRFAVNMGGFGADQTFGVLDRKSVG